MDGQDKDSFGSRGIKSIEVGYRVLLAVQRGPQAVPLAEVAKRAGLSGGAAHNYLASFVRTGLIEQEGRGRYRLGPSVFALSLNSFQQQDSLQVLKAEAEALSKETGESVGVVVWSHAGPVSVFAHRSESLGGLEFRPGRVPMLSSGAGIVYAGYLDRAEIIEPILFEISQIKAGISAEEFIKSAQQTVPRQGFGLHRDDSLSYYVLAAPVWGKERHFPFVLSLLSRNEHTVPQRDTHHVDLLLAACARAGALLTQSSVYSGPTARQL